MSATFPPLPFNEAFLSWFRERTEATWSQYDLITLDDYLDSEEEEMNAYEWQQGTRWLHGLTEAEITAIEKRWNVAFPPDYRLFLSKLHAPDQPQVAVFMDTDHALKLSHCPSFYNWQTDETVIQHCYDSLVEGLVWDALPGTWEQKKVQEERAVAERMRFQELVQAAPKLIPVCGNRYLLVEPLQEGNPVLSIHQSDMIVYSANFRDYLLTELLYLIDKELDYRILFDENSDEATSEFYERYGITRLKAKDYCDIPFWGEYLAYNLRSQ